MNNYSLSDTEVKSWSNWGEVDYVLALDGFNLTDFKTDICKRHHHFWFTRVTYLLAKRGYHKARVDIL